MLFQKLELKVQNFKKYLACNTKKLPFIIITIIIRIKPLLQNTVITIKSNNIDLNAE